MDLVTLLAISVVGMSEPAVDRHASKLHGAGIGGVTAASEVIDNLDSKLPRLSEADQWLPLIDEASRRFGLPAAWISAMMRAESGGRTLLDGRSITSHAGAMGLMQMMPETYEEMRQRYGLGPDPYDPRENILAGAGYLREMYDRYGYPGCFAAYNAGPARFDEYLLEGRLLPAETRRYLAALDLTSLDMPMRTEWASGRDLFFKLGMPTLGAQSLSSDASSGALFVPPNKARRTGSRAKW